MKAKLKDSDHYVAVFYKGVRGGGDDDDDDDDDDDVLVDFRLPNVVCGLGWRVGV